MNQTRCQEDAQQETNAGPRGAPPETDGLQPSDLLGMLHLIVPLLLTLGGLLLASSTHVGPWLIGQLLLSLAFLSWFCVLHEAGHKTLFKTAWLNVATGHVAGTLALIPFASWKMVHAQHHRWTGWHDLDPTTSQSLPHEPKLVERLLVNTSWRLWIPLFSVAYRLGNYWHLPWLWKTFPRPRQRRQLTVSFLLVGAVYTGCAFYLGPARLIVLLGFGLYLSLIMQDLLILSQHSHIPMPQSGGRKVRPFPPLAQERYTRSLVFPSLFARLVLLNLDAHELHHMYPRIPGYWLHTLHYHPQNAIPWWRWIWEAKRIPASVLLFQNRDQTGYRF